VAIQSLGLAFWLGTLLDRPGMLGCGWRHSETEIKKSNNNGLSTVFEALYEQEKQTPAQAK
jgi:hypothetical protein